MKRSYYYLIAILCFAIASVTFLLKLADTIKEQPIKVFNRYLSSLGFNDPKFTTIEPSIRGLALSNFSTTGNISIHVPKIELILGFDFSELKFFAKEVYLYSPEIRVEVERPLDLKQMSSNSNTKRDSISKLFQRVLRLGSKIIVVQSSISLEHKRIPQVTAKGNFSLNPQDSVIEYNFTSIGIKDLATFQDIQGEVKLGVQEKNYTLVITDKPYTDSKWQAQVEISKSLKWAKLNIKSSGISQSWTQFAPFIHNSNNVNYAVSLRIDFHDKINFKFYGASTDLKISHTKLSEKPIGPIPFKITALGSLNPASRKIEIDRGQVKIFDLNRNKDSENIAVYYSTEGTLVDPNEDIKIKLIGEDLNCNSIISAAPDGIIDEIKKFKGQGRISFEANIAIPIQDPHQFKLNYSVDNGCKFFSDQKQYSKSFLKWRTLSPDIDFKFKTPQQQKFLQNKFVNNYSKYFRMAVIDNEDPSFATHNGFSMGAILSALRANLSVGYFKFGGSTITMQLVKNLYFKKEKTISRKIQELFLSRIIETILSKDEILDIYANIVEFGPEIFGIQDAAAFYFNKRAENLTLLESVYLTIILPAPKRYFSNFCSNRLDTKTRLKLDGALVRLYSKGKIDRETFRDSLAEGLNFKHRKRSQLSSCPIALSKHRPPLKRVTF